jgi:hypothetical protein
VQTEGRKAVVESLLCQVYAEVKAAFRNESLNGNGEELPIFIHAARVGIIYDDERAIPTNWPKMKIRDRLVEVEDRGYEHPAFVAVSLVFPQFGRRIESLCAIIWQSLQTASTGCCWRFVFIT